MTRIAPYVIAALALGLSACTNPYDPVQRGFAGGLWGAASGAAIGAAAGGGPGAALGAAVEGATGIFGGVATTPPPPPGTYYGYPAYGYPAYGYPGYGYPAYPRPGYGYPGYSGAPVIPVPRLMDTRADLRRRVTLLLLATDTPAIRNIPLSPVHQPMGTKATQDTPATPVLRAMVSRAAWNSRATSVLPAMNREPTWSTHPTQVPLALNMGWNRVKPRCRRLRAMNTRARRRIPVTPFPAYRPSAAL